MSIDAAYYQAPIPSLFRRTESAAQIVARRGGRLTAYHQAAERVISTILERLDEPLLLEDMAEIAQLSPYHFNRIFRQITGIPPGKFQGALRVQAAKRLLVTTQLSVTEICFMVGYNSLGTFTSSFTALVGLSPSQLRAHAKDRSWEYIQSLAAALSRRDQQPAGQSGCSVQGKLSSQEPFTGPILIGLFNSPIPESQPVACTLVTDSDRYQIQDVPRGEYYMLAAAFDRSYIDAAELLQDQPLMVGKARATIVVNTASKPIKADILLRPVQSIDPPILVALSQLLDEQLKQITSCDCAGTPAGA
jgi:AraC-like DNA-binding protein